MGHFSPEERTLLVSLLKKCVGEGAHAPIPPGSAAPDSMVFKVDIIGNLNLIFGIALVWNKNNYGQVT
jgi:hypothetical protein